MKDAGETLSPEVNAAIATAFENRRRRQRLSGVEFVRWLGFDDIADEMERDRDSAQDEFPASAD